MFAELLAHPGVVEQCELRSSVGLMAFHGGNLERGTDDIAREVARRSRASLYAVVQPADLRWHIPSTAVQPDASPALASFLDHVDVAIALHGYGRDGWWTRLLVGGGNRTVAAHVGSALREALAVHDYEVIDELDAIPVELRGVHPRNPVNLARRGGAQLELPPRVRGQSPLSKPEHTAALIDGLAQAVQAITD